MATNRLAPERVDTGGPVWTFAGREFDESRLELRVSGKAVDLELKPLEVLVHLLQHAGEVVSKNELLEAVWPGLSVVEGSLSTAVHKLRKALSDQDSKIVVTVPRVGYRLEAVARVEPSRPVPLPAKVNFVVGNPVPGREHWRLLRALDASANGEVWLAKHPKTGELRVFKFVTNVARLKALKREVTVFRFLRESQRDQQIVRIFEWNFDTEPYFLESEYGGLNLREWAEDEGGLCNIPLQRRIRVLSDIARAVAEVHGVGVLHKDLKPANVLVSEEQVKIADFGSACLLEQSRLQALGITSLGMTQTGVLQSTFLSGTLMYLAPEVLSGNAATAQADVYALGVMLYQMVVGDFRKPLSPGWEDGVADPLLREDIAAAVSGDLARRLSSPMELTDRLDSLDRRRAERDSVERARQQQQIAEHKRTEARARRPWIALACVALVALAISLFLSRRPLPPANAPLSTVAVLPFQNVGAAREFDYLSLALADEVATTLSYARGLSVQPLSSTRKYSQPDVDLRKAGEEMNAASIVTGHFVAEGEQLHLTLEAVDVKSGRLLWQNTLDAPGRNLLELREKIAARTQGVLAAALGGSAYTVNKGTRPANGEAYDLYLRAVALPPDIGTNEQATAMLEKSVGLDADFAPAWLLLGRRYYIAGRYGDGGNIMLERSKSAEERALALDPDYIEAATSLVGWYVEDGALPKGFAQAEDLVRRRPDSADAHYMLSYTLRYAGLLDESARQCEIAFSLDPHTRTSAFRSCSIVFALQGNYRRAGDFLNGAPSVDFSKAISITTLLREGKEKEALQIGTPRIPQWSSYDMVLACAQRKPAPEIAAMAATIRPADDPEANYLTAANLSYCGQTGMALAFLRQAVEGNYCSYPAMDSDPLLAGLRHHPEFARIRAAGIACQQEFLAARQRIEQQALR
jgi:serine/threonine protein kinase/DNA-binding winged helix-turn-helix (wHTH) protein